MYISENKYYCVQSKIYLSLLTVVMHNLFSSSLELNINCVIQLIGFIVSVKTQLTLERNLLDSLWNMNFCDKF